MSDTPRDPTDERDERLAALMQTEPLDDVTRTRLVRTAMDASIPDARAGADRPHRGAARWLALAAALVVVLAIGFAVFAGNGSDSGPTAARSSRPSPADLDTTASDALENRSLSVGAGSLGNLGDVSTRALLRRAVNAAEATTAGRAPKASDESAGAIAALPQAATTRCQPSLPGDVVAVGTGTEHGAPVTVYVVAHKDGSRAAVTVDSGCRVGKPVPL